MTGTNIKSLSAFVWSIAELLRGDYKQSEYGKVVLPFFVLRRLDCLLEESKAAVLETAKSLPDDMDDETKDLLLSETVGQGINIYNLSQFTFASLKNQDAKDIHTNLTDYITKFSPNIRDVFLEKFLFTEQLKRLNDAALLYQVFDQFTQIDLHPGKVSNIEMGYLFEELIRRFSEISNETAGEHYTPREVIRLIVSLLLVNDREALTGTGVIRQVYDPAAGTGGMLAICEMAMRELNDRIRVELFGQ
ncbi:MAG: type I restriction-modification system subunit M N-terminal domain-containing protein, partial [Candidatus Dadabacteria bacterium]|nr:type I restriction-modification system subunit M N-terminal domain-containing protein [Candidatus Dadabacteria bacterium]